MMRVIAKRWCLSLLIGLLSSVMFAQEKTQSYYNTHESEILPDATIAFQSGKYERTVELCKWHYIIVGDNAADSLREKAERCAQLKEEMEEDLKLEKINEARVNAKALLSINSNDSNAKKVLEDLEKPDVKAPIDTIISLVPIVQDTIVAEKPIQQEIIKDGSGKGTEPEKPIIYGNPPRTVAAKTRFVLKANACTLGPKQMGNSLAPGGSIGCYDLGGTPFGLEAGAYFCPDLSAESVSLFGVDASIVFRVMKKVYPKAGVGFFSYKSTHGIETGAEGLCAGLGCTFLLSGHICLELGVKYYPALKLSGSETVSTAGSSYEFPMTREVYPGGIAPMVGFGWAF